MQDGVLSPSWHSPSALATRDATLLKVSCPTRSVTSHLNSTPCATSVPFTDRLETMLHSSSSSASLQSGSLRFSTTFCPRYQVRASPVGGYTCVAEQVRLAGCPGRRVWGAASSLSVSGRAGKESKQGQGDF